MIAKCYKPHQSCFTRSSWRCSLVFSQPKRKTPWRPTSDGIMLIDSGYPDEVERVLIGGMQKLGLDPAEIKALP